MKITEIAVKKPYITLMVFLALLLMGGVALQMIPVDILPDIEIPRLTVITIYPGASAENVEEQVTKYLEKNLSGIGNLKHIESTSKDNISIIQLSFDFGVNLDEAANDARTAIELSKVFFPSGVETPNVLKISTSMFPILQYSITAEENFNMLDEIVEDKIVNRLKTIPGVASVMVVGLPKREIQLNLSPDALKQYNISIEQIKAILNSENITIPAGDLDIGMNKWMVTIPGKIKSISELENIVISNHFGHLIYLKDVVEIKDTFSELQSISRANGSNAGMFMILKQTGANVVEVSDAVKERMDFIQQSLPEDVKVNLMSDNSGTIKRTLKNLILSVITAIIVVALVVLFFLRRFRASFIVLISIPISLILAFLGLYLQGYTINTISLMSMAIAIGIVVDNSIVVLENINQYRNRGVRLKEASIYGATEMGQAITASTLTTIVVFLPLVFLGGLIGIMFKQLAFVIIITISASLFTALTLTPMLTSKLFKMKDKNILPKIFYSFSEKLFEKLDVLYERFLTFTLKHKIHIIIVVGILFLLTLSSFFIIGTDFFPDQDSGQLTIVVETPIGTGLETTMEVVKQVERIIQENTPELMSMFSITGQTEEGMLSIGGFEEGSNISTILINLSPIDERTRSSSEVEGFLRDKLTNIPNLHKISINSGSMMNQLLQGGGKEIEIYVYGNDLDQLNIIAKEIAQKIKDIEGIINLKTTIDYGRPELQIVVDREKASRVGLNTLLIAAQVRQAIYGQETTEFTEHGKEYDIVIRYDNKYRNSKEDIENIVLNTLLGEQVLLKDIAEIIEANSPLVIARRDQQRNIRVQASTTGRSHDVIIEDINNVLLTIHHPQNVEISLGGKIEQQSESFRDIYIALGLGFILVYMVMVAQFGSFRDPFIIMISIPFTLTGIVISFLITGNTFNIVTSIGMLMLLGVVVNNGIVLVDYMNILRARGLSLKDSVTQGGRSRIRPVLMTTLTTFFGLTPLAFSRGEGHEIWSPFATTAMAGLLMSTIVTLVIIPILYYIFHQRQKQTGDIS